MLRWEELVLKRNMALRVVVDFYYDDLDIFYPWDFEARRGR